MPHSQTAQTIPFQPILDAQDVDVQAARERFNRLEMVAKNKCRDWHNALDDYERDFLMLNTGDDDPDKDEGKKARLSDLRDAVTISSNILQNAGHQLILKRPGDSEPDKAKSGAVERFLNATFDYVQQTTGENLKSTFVNFQMRLGVGILHWAYVEEAYQATNELGAPLNAPPVCVWVVDPRNFYPMVGGPQSQFRYVLHIDRRSVQDAYDFVSQTFGEDSLARQQLDQHYGHYDEVARYQQEFEFKNYWGWERINGEWRIVNALMYGDALLRDFEVMERYRIFPWAMAPAHDTRSDKYVHRWLPITHAAKHHVRRAERYMARLDRITDKLADMPYVAKGGETHQEPPEVKGSEDDIVNLYHDQSFEPPNYGQAPVDLYQLLDVTQDRVYRSLLPQAMYGIGGLGERSGYSFEQLQEGGRLKLIEPRNNLAFAFQQMFRGIAQLVAYHKPDDIVYATYREEPEFGQQQPDQVHLMGRDLLGWHIKCKWSDELPGDEMQATARAVQLKGAGLLSDETILERVLGVEDPLRELDLQIKEQVKRSHPTIAEAYAMDVLRKMNAIPNIEQGQIQSLVIEARKRYGQALAAGATPEQAQQVVMDFLAGIRMSMMGANPMMQMMARAGPEPQAQPPAQTQRDTNDRREREGERRRTQRTTGFGLGPQFRGNQPQPGNPSDPGGAQREQANRMNRAGTMP